MTSYLINLAELWICGGAQNKSIDSYREKLEAEDKRVFDKIHIVQYARDGSPSL